MQNLKNRICLQILVIYTRYLMGGAFVFASLIKIKGKRFTSASGLEEPIDSAWHFFETMYQSGLYWKFIGIGQLLAGMLLMTQRFAKLGALIYLPIIGNIFIITISYYFAFTPVITGSMLVANLLLIAWDWDTFKVLLNQPQDTGHTPRLEHDLIWQHTGLVLFAFTFIYRLLVDQYDMFFWAGVCFVIAVIGLVIGFKRRSKYKE